MTMEGQTETVFVKLLDEGTEVARPTSALPLGDGLYELLPTPDYNADIETWEFLPGSKVEVELTARSGGPILLAVARR